MPRPRKKRMVEDAPFYCRFAPADGNTYGEPVIMTIDEFETIRLIDLAGLDQSGCARQMNIARTTAQNIYNSARRKIASALFYGHELRIEGGDYILTEEMNPCRSCSRSGSIDRIGGIRDLQNPEVTTMKIAVTYDPTNEEIFQHYGRTEFFKVYDINVRENKMESAVHSTNGLSHGGLTGVITGLNANILVCGGIGGGAQNALVEQGVRVFAGCTGNADAAIEQLMKNELNYQEDYTCHDHHHEEGEGCHEHHHEEADGCHTNCH